MGKLIEGYQRIGIEGCCRRIETRESIKVVLGAIEDWITINLETFAKFVVLAFFLCLRKLEVRLQNANSLEGTVPMVEGITQYIIC